VGPETPKSWEELRREEPVNDRRVAVYRRLMEAQQLIAASRFAAGISDEAIDAAFEASVSLVPETESDEELYFGTVRRFVEALGGRLEGLRGMFPDGELGIPPLGL
jgi:hypothetical protein